MITFITQNQTVSTVRVSGAKLDELAFNNGLPLNRHCGGKGVCKRCLAIIGEGRYLLNGQELEIPENESLEVLACQTEVLSDVATISLPNASLIDNRGKIASDFVTRNLDFSSTENGFGIVCDIGTTTVVCALVELESGRVLARASKYNQQIRLAEDVASRISVCHDDSKVSVMQKLLIDETLNPLISEICDESGVSKDSIKSFTASGNAVMTHLLHGLNPRSIGEIPFTPVTRSYETVSAESLGIDICAKADVYTLPSISGYVGGDLTADIFVTNMQDESGVVLLIDIGTNGEMLLSDNGKIFASATAAGPAFEGAGIANGCRAAAGAIEKISLQSDGNFSLKTIANQPAVGICGSAIIDFIAELYRADLISMTGRFDLDELRSLGLYCQTDSGLHACKLTENICVSEKDISEILKAKAAIIAGVYTLLSECSKTVADIDRVILAGGFARYINLQNAISIGLLPDIPEHKYEVIGNGSLAGAYYVAQNPELLKKMDVLIDLPEVVDLNCCESFQDHFVDGLLLPE